MSAKSSVVNRIAPQGSNDLLALLSGLVGMAALIGLPRFGDPLDSSVQTGVLVAGGVLLFVGATLHTQLRYSSGVIEESKRRINYRAMFVSF